MAATIDAFTRIGNYDVRIDADEFAIFPKNRDGKSMRVLIQRQFIHLRHTGTGKVTTFKRYLHRKQWHWSDSRRKGPQPQHHVLGELSRMLFRGDERRAGDLIACCLLQLPLEQLAN